MKSVEPNLDPSRPPAMMWHDYSRWLEEQWAELLEADPLEAQVQTFLERNPALLPGATGDIGPGGHHGPELDAVFRQPPLKGLAKNKVPDFMWVTRSTSLITPICIEIERPGKNWFNKNGVPTGDLTQALDQLADWKVWFSETENQSIFRKTYLRGAYANRALRPQYLLIYGRRREFEPSYGRHRDPSSLLKKRDFMARADEYFMTFDSLKPLEANENHLTLTQTSDGPIAFALPPTFTLGPSLSHLVTTVRDPTSAVKEMGQVSEERKDYLLERWSYWRDYWDSPSDEIRAYSPRVGE